MGKKIQLLVDNSTNAQGMEPEHQEVTRYLDSTPRSEAPILNDGNPTSEDVMELLSLLNEPLPDAETDAPQLDAFIRRQYRGHVYFRQRTAEFQHRIGTVLLMRRKDIPHGEWETFVETTYGFTSRTALNYMKLAEEKTVEEARTLPLGVLWEELGITQPSKKSKGTRGATSDMSKNQNADKVVKIPDPKCLGNNVERLERDVTQMVDFLEALPPDSYLSNEEYSHLVRDVCTRVHGVRQVMKRIEMMLLELAKTRTQSTLEDISQVQDRITRESDEPETTLWISEETDLVDNKEEAA